MITAEVTSHATQNNSIVYEMPLTDAVRICLRLENLFEQFDRAISETSLLATKNAMSALLKILEVTDRPDLKSKLSQTLTQYSSQLLQLNRSAQVNTQKLQTTLRKLEALNHYLHTHHARIGEQLRQNDFLYQIRTNLTVPGGVCDFRLPAYMLWQNKTSAEKTKDLKEWMGVFKPLRDISEAVMQLTRDSTSLQPVTAENGFYLQPLNPTVPYHLIRLALPRQLNLYPEFSIGKHRITIRFLTPNYFGSGKSTQTQTPTQFQLACCRI